MAQTYTREEAIRRPGIYAVDDNYGTAYLISFGDGRPPLFVDGVVELLYDDTFEDEALVEFDPPPFGE